MGQIQLGHSSSGNGDSKNEDEGKGEGEIEVKDIVERGTGRRGRGRGRFVVVVTDCDKVPKCIQKLQARPLQIKVQYRTLVAHRPALSLEMPPQLFFLRPTGGIELHHQQIQHNTRPQKKRMLCNNRTQYYNRQTTNLGSNGQKACGRDCRWQ